jgi:hypothetical protein
LRLFHLTSLQKSLNSTKTFKIIKKKPNFFWKCLKKELKSLQKPHTSQKSLFFFKKLQNLSKCPTRMKTTSIYLEIILKSPEFFEKASHHFKKVSILLKMSSQISYLSLYISENAFKKPRKFY